MLNVVMLSVVILNVVAPIRMLGLWRHNFSTITPTPAIKAVIVDAIIITLHCSLSEAMLTKISSPAKWSTS